MKTSVIILWRLINTIILEQWIQWSVPLPSPQKERRTFREISGSSFESRNAQDKPGSSSCTKKHRSYQRFLSQMDRGAKMNKLPVAKDRKISSAIKINYCREPIPKSILMLKKVTSPFRCLKKESTNTAKRATKSLIGSY